MRHQAIYNTHPNVKGITGPGVEVQCVDIDSNPVEIDETLVEPEITRLQAEYDALAWKRSREENYPTIAELTVALYDTDDKSAVEAKRASVKAKYPKP